jgi:shikimate kinase
MSGAVVLVGLSGSGKSTVGRLLARQMRRQFVDTDRLIEERIGGTIAAFFASAGEEAFRDLEQDVLSSSCTERAVVATGGGVILRAANRLAMRRGNLVVWLDPPLTMLAERLANHHRHEVRPLLQGDLEDRLRDLARVRRALYAVTAHIRVTEASDAHLSAWQIAEGLSTIYANWCKDNEPGCTA